MSARNSDYEIYCCNVHTFWKMMDIAIGIAQIDFQKTFVNVSHGSFYVPWPNAEAFSSTVCAVPKPSFRHTTLAATLSKSSPHTVPQRPAWKTSKRPSPNAAPAFKRTSDHCYKKIYFYSESNQFNDPFFTHVIMSIILVVFKLEAEFSNN